MLCLFLLLVPFLGSEVALSQAWVVGKPTEAQKRIAHHLAQVHEKILAVMKPEMTLGDIFDLGREEMRSLKYISDKAAMPANGRGLGGVTIHGIGLGPMHDPPHVEDKDVKLESGMTLAVAGGVRHAKFTIRFEDDFVVVPGGIELINKLSQWGL